MGAKMLAGLPMGLSRLICICHHTENLLDFFLFSEIIVIIDKLPEFSKYISWPLEVYFASTKYQH